MSKIENDVGSVRSWICIAMHAGATRRREFDKYILVVELYRVVAGLGCFVSMIEARGVAFARVIAIDGVQIRLANSWHEENVTIIGDTCTAEMRVTESVDDVVGVMVAGAAVPTRKTCIRAQLDHTEGHDRPWKCVTVSASADEWIDVTSEFLLRIDC